MNSREPTTTDPTGAPRPSPPPAAADPHASRLPDEFPGAHDDRSDGRPQPLGEAEHQGVAYLPVVRGRYPGGDRCVEDPGPVDVERGGRLAADAPDPPQRGHGEDRPPARAVGG